jgi:hypothetical protein
VPVVPATLSDAGNEPAAMEPPGRMPGRGIWGRCGRLMIVPCSGRKCANFFGRYPLNGSDPVEGVDQPGSGEGPQPVSAPRGKTKSGGSLPLSEACEVPEFHKFGGL